MTDDFIDRRATGLGEVVVVERGGVAVPCYTGLNRQIGNVCGEKGKQQVRKSRKGNVQ